MKRSMQFWKWNKLTYQIKIGKKLDLGRSWARFGEGLGRCGASFGRSWATLGQFWRVQNRAFFQHGPKMGSKRPSGQIWAGFGEVWERFWEGWEGCSTALLLHLISCAYCLSFVGIHFAKGTPALPRYAPRSVTIRGGSQNRYACCTCL